MPHGFLAVQSPFPPKILLNCPLGSVSPHAVPRRAPGKGNGKLERVHERVAPAAPGAAAVGRLLYPVVYWRGLAGGSRLMRRLTLWQAVAISTQLGFLLAVSVLVGFALGWVVDQWTGVGAAAYVVGALLGMLAGIYSVVKLVQEFLRG